MLSLDDCLQVAASEAGRVEEAARRHEPFGRALRRLRAAVRHGDLPAVRRWLQPEEASDGDARAGGTSPWRRLRRRWPQVPEPLAVCGALLAFEGETALLEACLFGELAEPRRFVAVGIDAYERLGDVQGSSLLQSEATVREAARCVLARCRREGIAYLELRCSPANVRGGELTPVRFVEVLEEVFGPARRAPQGQGRVDVRLLLSASRHRGGEQARRTFELLKALQARPPLAQAVVGVDLAGAEGAASAAAFREVFAPARRQKVRITVHAGEDQRAESIWEAVYELNADRIGHGLTLGEDPALLALVRDRRVALELCPSSNVQVRGGFRAPWAGRRQGAPYPLARYLREGLRVTLNTDDPGISRTDLATEYWRAATMVEGGLSLWQLLGIARNGFRAAFVEHAARRAHLLAAERRLLQLAPRWARAAQGG